MKFALRVAVGVIVALPAAARADVWDRDTNGLDDGNGTRNELVHGAVQVHDLAAQSGGPDQDWYVVRSRPYSSYEVVGEGLTGDLAGVPGLSLDRVDAAGMVLTSGGELPGGGSGFTRSLRWRNDTAAVQIDFARASAPTSCAANCDANDQYTIRFFDTTAAVPRFSNGGTQITVLIAQNRSSATINATTYFWNDTGALAGQTPFFMLGHGVFVLNTAIPAPNISGAITITHDGRYGDLSGKAIAVEPATGFTFDTAMVLKPQN